MKDRIPRKLKKRRKKHSRELANIVAPFILLPDPRYSPLEPELKQKPFVTGNKGNLRFPIVRIKPEVK